MRKQNTPKDALAAWKRIPGKIESSFRGLRKDELDLKGGPEGWTIREIVHHLVEANLVATNMIVAALATNGGNFDWTWVNPSKSWMHRVGYDTADVTPAIKALQALTRHISTLVSAKPGAFSRAVRLNDTPGGPRYSMTVEDILRQEVDHATEHLKDIRQIRTLHSR